MDKLGKRLVVVGDPAENDLDLLQQVLAAYDPALAAVLNQLTDLGFEPTGRLKTTSTLIDKLRRQARSGQSMGLKGMQDIAGVRIVVPGGRTAQDAAVARVVERFEELEGCRSPIDRRREPSHGYRAVHVIVTAEGLPVEVQVRTELQDLWAQTFERLADQYGRGIRYGEDPLDPDLQVGLDVVDAPWEPGLSLVASSASSCGARSPT